jgi:hypothetical protein
MMKKLPSGGWDDGRPDQAGAAQAKRRNVT